METGSDDFDNLSCYASAKLVMHRAAGILELYTELGAEHAEVADSKCYWTNIPLTFENSCT